MRGEPLVEVRGLSKGYREGDTEHVVLAGAEADIRRGELVVLLGPSGSGKSTLLNLISGIDEPDAGSVRIAGVTVTALGERERTLFRRRRLGFVFQFYNLLPTLTVEENLLLPLELSGRTGAAERRRALELLEEVGLARRAGTYPDRLSGGEQQRIAIARALVHDPLLVLADEPTGNLDPETGTRVLTLLDRLTRRAGRTILVVTHSAELVALADRVLTIRRGKLVEEAASESGPTGEAPAVPGSAIPRHPRRAAKGLDADRAEPRAAQDELLDSTDDVPDTRPGAPASARPCDFRGGEAGG